MSAPRLRLLVVTPFAPRRDAPDGGRRITAEALAGLGERVDVSLLALRAADEPPVDPELHERCVLVREVERRTVGRSPRTLWRERRRVALAARRVPGWAVGHTVAAAREQLAELVGAWRPDVVQLEFVVLADLARSVPDQGPPVVIVDHDARPAPGSGSPAAWRRLRRLAAASADAFVVFTDTDREALRADVGAGVPVEVIPLGMDVPPERHEAPDGLDVLFVGGVGHPPNADAVRRLVDEIHPRVRSRIPAARLVLVGDGAAELAAREGVVVAGRLEETGEAYARAAVVVAPLRMGGGMRVKVLEAFAAGRPLVASSLAVEGLDVRHGEHLLVADGDEATAAAIADVLLDPALARRLGAAARAWAEASLGWQAHAAAYEALYRRLLGARTA